MGFALTYLWWDGYKYRLEFNIWNPIDTRVGSLYHLVSGKLIILRRL